MSIYTKTGDRGTTSLFGGTRVSKSDPRIEATGAIDELTSVLGWVVAASDDKKLQEEVTRLQSECYKIMAVIAGSEKTSLNNISTRISQIEKQIDAIDRVLPKLTGFIVPQGGELSSRLHIARSACRRAERSVIIFFENNKNLTIEPTISHNNKAIILQFLNRLSDYLFIHARKYSTKEVLAKEE
ncbi:cob(I)yrinic acid a,c-diamide adenosyltransferase [Candidatus Roizmanbacteria bacterium]|nr:cob(I)yrinic acid a,c-diamide adenosyltransferase [Candidatus Roizmanbacteria bacterium]